MIFTHSEKCTKYFGLTVSLVEGPVKKLYLAFVELLKASNIYLSLRCTPLRVLYKKDDGRDVLLCRPRFLKENGAVRD